MAFTSHCSGACAAAAHPAAHADKPLFPVMRKNSSCVLAPINASLLSSRSSVFEGVRSRLSGQRIFPPKKYNLLKTVMTATMPRESAKINLTGKTTEKPLPLRSSHLPPEKMEIFDHLQGWAETDILSYLKPVEKSWQPQDLLPDPSSEGFMDEVRDLRLRSRELPDDYLICLVGDMITEEAIPTYQTMLNTMDGIRDETASSASPWARWIRAWTAEENRHGDLLNKYLYLTGRVDMRKIEQTIQYLIGSGMNPQTDNSAYLGIIYTSFQERATFISHGNTARQARLYGDMTLAQVCGTIAADERRHENAYTKVVEKLFEIDTDYTMLCFEEMMKKKITMPAHLMFDGVDRNIYDRYSLVAQRTGVYTARDYADILEHLIKRWNVGKLQGLSSRGKQAQEYVCRLPEVVRKLEERSRSRVKKGSRTGTVSWIFNREVALV